MYVFVILLYYWWSFLDMIMFCVWSWLKSFCWCVKYLAQKLRFQNLRFVEHHWLHVSENSIRLQEAVFTLEMFSKNVDLFRSVRPIAANRLWDKSFRIHPEIRDSYSLNWYGCLIDVKSQKSVVVFYSFAWHLKNWERSQQTSKLNT